MANKLKLEDTCLTVEQAKELQKLGVYFSEPIHHFYRSIEEKGSRKSVGPWLIINEKICQTCGMGTRSEFIPTLTNSEMLGMIPKTIEHKINKYSYPPSYAEGKTEYKFYLDFDFSDAGYNIYYALYGYEGIEEKIPHSTKPKDGWYGSDDKEGFSNILLRDSLFEMIKYLKTNKLM